MGFTRKPKKECIKRNYRSKPPGGPSIAKAWQTHKYWKRQAPPPTIGTPTASNIKAVCIVLDPVPAIRSSPCVRVFGCKDQENKTTEQCIVDDKWSLQASLHWLCIVWAECHPDVDIQPSSLHREWSTSASADEHSKPQDFFESPEMVGCPG